MRIAREKLGLSQVKISELFGCSARTYQKNEAGLNEAGICITNDFIQLGVNANWLLTGEGEMLLVDHQAKLARVSNEVFGDAPLRVAQNPNVEYAAALKRVAEATQATVRVSKQFDFALPVEWTSLIQELMALHGLSEAGAKRVIEALKH